MNYEQYYDICNFSQKFYEDNPEFLPTNNICDNSRSKIKRCNVINDDFNALFYYEYIMYLIGIRLKCLTQKKN